MKFENIELAKKELVEAILNQLKATEEGDHKTGNKNSDIIRAITAYIKENYGLQEMKDLLDHESDKVKVWAAKSLLPIYEEIALNILEKIGSKNIPHCSFDARMILSEWKKEPYKFS